MATKTKTPATLRRCVGSQTFGIEAHEAPLSDFPVQPSRKDGLGVMCKPHWTEYTRALRRASAARKAADAPTPAKTATKPESARTRHARETLAAVDKLGGKAYTDAIGSAEVQSALEAVNGHDGGTLEEAETPHGEAIDAGTEKADAA
jgi:hypothetical protein